MAAGLSILQNLSRLTTTRTVLIKVVPRPIKFAERRAVLHAVQKFGAVEVFRKLDDEDDTFISVLSDSTRSVKLIRQSPLQYQLLTGPANDSITSFLDPSSIGTTSADAEPILSSESTQDTPVESGKDVERKRFVLHIFPCPTYSHSAAIRASPLHGQWPIRRREADTSMSSMLRKSLPDDIAASGLSDWESHGQIFESSQGLELEDNLFGHKSLNKTIRHRAERVQKRERLAKLPAAMSGLVQLRQEREDSADENVDQIPPSRQPDGGNAPL